jgi:formate dehydrogenase major subunit
MELGEPDASGRQRPVKVEGSEFDIELDYILAAIGQKTNVNFIDDINQHAEKELVLNKWGDINADPKTLQTSIPNVFACGDGVTGPATLIEAIAQARLAAQSCNKYLLERQLPLPTSNLSAAKITLPRKNPKITMLLLKNKAVKKCPPWIPLPALILRRWSWDILPNKPERNLRCLECGCSEYYTCDLKKYSTQYQAEQKNLDGSYQEFQVDFSHPHIEIDNNKCILCGRCVRICKEVVGANALGLVNRGFRYLCGTQPGKQA